MEAQQENTQNNPPGQQPPGIDVTAEAGYGSAIMSDDEQDGCDVEATELTSDEDLPESKGGMS
jgi:hypothetical protein